MTSIQHFREGSRRFGFRAVLRRISAILALCALPAFDACCGKPAAPPDGAALFSQKCASCHRPGNDMRAPAPEALHQMSKTAILAALESGRMKWEGKLLSEGKKNAIGDYLAAPAATAMASNNGYCARDLDPPPNPPTWTGWGADLRNRRYQPALAAGFTRRQIGSLKLKWAFGFAGAAATYGQPTAFKGRVFVGGEDGTVYALDSATGCVWWTFKASGTVKTAVSIGNHGTTAFFGDANGLVYAVRVDDGALLWKVHADPHPAARIIGSPLLVSTRRYVPVSSGEEGASADPDYPCCTFRGSVISLDALSGRKVWKTYTIDDAPQPTRKNTRGVQY
jgi:polyvinyl alcohol dehydrogenase (cytochrome)